MIINVSKLVSAKALSYEFRLYQDDLSGFVDEYSGTIDENGILVKGSITKLSAEEFLLKFTVQGTIIYLCARCLEPTPLKSVYEYEETIKTEPGTEELDLRPYVYECLFINEPFKVLCDEACKGLCPSCGANLNHENCSCGDTLDIDPRMEALKKLL
ncbi:MAG: DUF177 domain-containing protein [Eubacterium sp.]|nr:DUF177 domain-containing protein [Eubacterium sp.]